MAVGAWAFFVNEEGVRIGAMLLRGVPLFYFLFLTWDIPLQVRADFVFAVLLLIYGTAFAGAFLIGKRLDHAILESFKHPLAGSFRNWLFTMPVITSMLFIGLVALASFQESQGIQTGSPNISDRYIFFFDVAYAPVVEELGFRIIPLGTFLILRTLLFSRTRFGNLTGGQIVVTLLLAFLLPDRYRRNLGLSTVEKSGFRKSLHASDWAIILLTAFSFGLAHYFGGIGWDVGKISLTFISGLVFGPLFMLYGAPATILAHWMFNFYLTSYALAPSSFILLPVLSILITGSVGWVGAFAKAVIALRRRIQQPENSFKSMMAQASYCVQCGTPFVSGSAYCVHCGAPRALSH